LKICWKRRIESRDCRRAGLRCRTTTVDVHSGVGSPSFTCLQGGIQSLPGCCACCRRSFCLWKLSRASRERKHYNSKVRQL
jgi:hypothetical protein